MSQDPVASTSSYARFRAVNEGDGPQASPLPLSYEQAQATHQQTTLHRIQSIANDVDMQPPPSETQGLPVFIIVDTNILLAHYEALRTFVEDVEKTHAPVKLVFPGIVVQELDWQKSKQSLAWPARRASGWLLERLKIPKQQSVKVQATEETCKPSRNWRTRMEDELHIAEDMMNDHLIIDCAQYFQRVTRDPIAAPQGRAWMCSADNNLCIIAAAQGLHIMTPPAKGLWTSRDIICSIYGPDLRVAGEFSSTTGAYRIVRRSGQRGGGRTGSVAPSASSRATPAMAAEDTDSMDVDDDDLFSVEETPLNVLHDEVREYFTRLLLPLVKRLGADKLIAGNASVHAPAYVRKHWELWNASECLGYLYDQKAGLKQSLRSPMPDVFLSKRYTTQGARTGQEWATADWKVGLSNLEVVGDAFGEQSLRESVQDLQRYLGDVLERVRR